MTGRLRPLLLPALLTLLMGAFLIALGVWQLHRLSWKEGIISRIETRTKAAPQPLPPRIGWADLHPDDYEYRRVTLVGAFVNDKESLIFRGSADGPGFLVMTPFALKDGGTVLVNRGFVPEDRKARATRAAGEPEGEVRLTGLMRQPEPRNLFTPADEPARDMFFTRDPIAIAAHDKLVDAAPFTIDADATPNAGGWPRGGATELSIPNNHLSYALTWFGLALGLFGVFASFAWKRLRPPREIAEHGRPLRVSSPG